MDFSTFGANLHKRPKRVFWTRYLSLYSGHPSSETLQEFRFLSTEECNPDTVQSICKGPANKDMCLVVWIKHRGGSFLDMRLNITNLKLQPSLP